MTLKTKRNNIKAMFPFITWMMVFGCYQRTVSTVILSSFREFSSVNCFIDSILRFISFWITEMIIKVISLFCSFTFFALMIFSSTAFYFFGIVRLVQINLCSIAYFTITSIAIFPATIFVKLRNQFSLFANCAGFVYDDFRHLLLLIGSKCLEPVTGYAPAIGSFIIKQEANLSNKKYARVF